MMCDSSASVAVLTTSTMTTSPALQSVPEPPGSQASSTAMTSATLQPVPEPHCVLATSVAAPQSVPEPPDGEASSTATTSDAPQSVPEPQCVLATSVAAPQSVPEPPDGEASSTATTSDALQSVPEPHGSPAVIHVIDISPLPVLSVDQKAKKRKTRTSQAAELTSTPYKAQLESAPVNVKRSAARKLLIKETGNKRSFKKRNVKQKKPAAKRQKRERSSSTDDTPCCICQRKYNEPPLEEWQQCRICGQWFHDSCGPGDSDADVCYFCLE